MLHFAAQHQRDRQQRATQIENIAMGFIGGKPANEFVAKLRGR